MFDENGEPIPQDFLTIRTGLDNCVVADFNLNEYRPRQVSMQVHITSDEPNAIPVTVALSADVAIYSLIVRQSAAMVPKGIPIQYGFAMRDMKNGHPIKLSHAKAEVVSKKPIADADYQRILKLVKADATAKGLTLKPNSQQMAVLARYADEQGGDTTVNQALTTQTLSGDQLFGVTVTKNDPGIYRLKITATGKDDSGELHTLTRHTTAYVSNT